MSSAFTTRPSPASMSGAPQGENCGANQPRPRMKSGMPDKPNSRIAALRAMRICVAASSFSIGTGRAAANAKNAVEVSVTPSAVPPVRKTTTYTITIQNVRTTDVDVARNCTHKTTSRSGSFEPMRKRASACDAKPRTNPASVRYKAAPSNASTANPMALAIGSCT